MRYVYLPPLFDENKCSYRFGYCLKKHLDSIGIELERFDYRGTGEAKGEFCDVTLESLKDDIEGFIDGDGCTIIGVRFGASLGFDVCRDAVKSASKLILIEPVIDGGRYLRWLERGQAVKDTITGSGGQSLDEAGYMNIEGYKTSEFFLSQLERFSLLKNVEKLSGDISLYIGDICDTVNKQRIEQLCSLLKGNRKDYWLERIDVVQFWRRIGIGDYSKAVAKIGDWCNE